jgi:hypothetical protein
MFKLTWFLRLTHNDFPGSGIGDLTLVVLNTVLRGPLYTTVEKITGQEF